MNKLRVIGVDIGSDECIPHVEIVNDDGEVIGIAYVELVIMCSKKRS